MQIPSEILRQCWFLAGPTACGKTELSLRLAGRLNAEIIALDSMSLYRGMDIGTAKASAEERSRVPHHLIDCLDPHEDSSLADYIKWADRACREIIARGRTPLFVGGTGLYLRGILRGVFEGPPADRDFRNELEAAHQTDPHALHRRLQAIDPESAERLHPNDIRRVIRALEVHHVTGRPLSQQQRQTPLPPGERPRHVYWLEPPRDWLHERINRRVEQMFAEGLIEEVRGLLSRQPPLGQTARQALGYREVILHLEGAADRESTIREIQTRTRQFAKRQHTWFRNLEECHRVPITGQESGEWMQQWLTTVTGTTGPEAIDPQD